MKILPEPIAFEWDEGNKEKNEKKHNVTYKEAEEAFGNSPLIVSEDSKHSIYEKRFQALGKTDKGRFLFLSFTLRKNKVRIISARDMSRKEEMKYEEEV